MSDWDAGNEYTRARDAGLQRIAEIRHVEPMASWPAHEARHRRTIMGARLFDDECLRCHLEEVAAAKAAKKGGQS